MRLPQGGDEGSFSWLSENRRAFEHLSTHTQRVMQHVVQRLHISRDANRVCDDTLTFGQRLADRVAALGGSWTFITSFGALFLVWMLCNAWVFARHGNAFGSYPYILLNLVLSILAALQAASILMSQKRQATKDRLDAAHDDAVHLQAELDIGGLHDKLEHVRDYQWAEFVAMQQEEIRLLAQILRERTTFSDAS